MDGRPMIMGAEPNYDALMTVGAEPAQQQPHQYGPPPQPYYGQPQGYYPQQHHQHPQHHMQHQQQVHYLPQPQYAPPALAPAPQHQPARHIVNEPLTKSRDFPIGFSAFNIAPGPPVEIEVKPQVLFKGKRLAVANSICKDFVIVDIKVGTAAQLAATGEMSAEAFSALAVDTKMEFDTAAPGTTITIRVRNISNAPSNFLAVLYGAVMT